MFARCLLAVAVTAALAAVAPAADPTLPDGKYTLSYSGSPVALTHAVVFELKTTDGKADVKVLSGGPNKWTLSKWAVKDGLATAEVNGPVKWTFEGKVAADGGKVTGTLGDDARPMRAVVAKTELDEIDAKNSFERLPAPEEMKELNKLRSEPNVLRLNAQQEKDADKKRELLDQAKKAAAKVTAETPGLLRKIVDGSNDDAVLYYVVPDLLGQCGSLKPTAADVKGWAEKGLKTATAHGPRAERIALLNTAELLSAQDGLGDVALAYAEKAAAATDKGATGPKVRALKALAAAQAKAGKADLAKATAATVDKLETQLDEEYKKDGPGFTPTKYAGRKDKDANRVAVFEMFTGAMCPPCVAADLAFDGLETVYSPKDLILLQYHQHIPGPDPMTNADTIARWGYYGKLFPQEMRGVPSSVFDGKPKAGGGGGKPNAEKKFDEYKAIIDATLEMKADVTVTGTAKLDGGEVKVDATVSGKTEGTTVRVVLAEEEVRYLGGNGIRLHHQVVRSLFGKAEGWKVIDLKDGKATASVKLDDLKKTLTTYMETYHKETAKFSNPDRPLKFEHLNVIVMVQNDETGEILNAVQLPVGGKK